jgi:hexulose-6-phosphate isomerase
MTRRRIGFMQGRLVPPVDGRIQAFPWSCWRDEFATGARLGLGSIEWTLDQERLYENPLFFNRGQEEIRALSAQHNLAVSSVTGDCFMQAPFWKTEGGSREGLQKDFHAILEACAAVGISLIVIPLVDNGRIENRQQEDSLIRLVTDSVSYLEATRLRVVFESDYKPSELRRFIKRLDPARFGVNYDIGNSAYLGYDPTEEIALYGDRILNVHVKDRVRGGPTVPLGTGAADFDAVFAALHRASYSGIYVLQTARAADGDHAGVLGRYRDMTAEWIERHAA